MKTHYLLLLLAIIGSIVLFISCQKELTCYDCLGPIANAGRDTTIVFPNHSVMLDASASTDPDGTITSHRWTKITGPASFTIVNPTSATTVIKNLASGIYEFELKVTDDVGLTATDTVKVTVNEPTGNQAPITTVSTSDTVAANCNKAPLSGSAIDLDGSISTHVWTQLSGPNQVAIANPNSSATFFTDFTPGTYRFVFRATDNKGSSTSDTTEITIVAEIKEIIFSNLTWSYIPNDIPDDDPRLAPPSRPDLFCDTARVTEVAVWAGTEWVIAGKALLGRYTYKIYNGAALRVVGHIGLLIGTKASVRVRFL